MYGSYVFMEKNTPRFFKGKMSNTKIKHVLSASHWQFTPQHTSTHLSTLQHQVSYDAQARLWVRKTDKAKEGDEKEKKDSLRTETWPWEGREEVQRGRWNRKEEKGVAKRGRHEEWAES